MGRADDIEVLEKRLSESKIFHFDFSAKMDDGESISTLVSLVSTPTTAVTALTLGTPTLSQTKVQVRISGGEDGGKYLQVCKVMTDQDNELQCDGYLLVREPS